MRYILVNVFPSCGQNLWNVHNTSAFSEPCEAFKMVLSTKEVEGCKLLRIIYNPVVSSSLRNSN